LQRKGAVFIRIELTVSGLVALSDYSALFSDNGDMMFDAVKFGVAVVTEEGFEQFPKVHLHYNYAWRYGDEPEDVIAEKERSEEVLEIVRSNGMIANFLPRYLNQAICFTGEDMGSDRAMMITLLYIMIVIIAFVFAVTTNNTITKEAAVIGTLRASGYSRGEILIHYLSLPLFVTLLAAVVGNGIGYTFFKDVCAGMYYGSYSLPAYVTRWNAEAFVLTTVVPFLIMLIVNIFLLYSKLRFPPLQFLRRDLSRVQNKKAVRLPKFRFLNRFRIRIIIQNKSGYLTLLLGIIFANLLLLFGMMMSPILAHYQTKILENMIADYQYVLKMPVETETEGAEKYAFTSLETIEKNDFKESVGVYGIIGDSAYLSMDLPKEGVFVSDVYADKYRLHIGDTITLKEKYSEKEYDFKVEGIFVYPSNLSVFMSIEEFRKVFEKEEDYYTGYFSNQEIEDIGEEYIASTITQDDLTKVSRQLDVSMGNMFILFHIFAVALSALLLYLLTKLIIEKNTTSISMVKILGYENKEISSLYLTATTWVVVISMLLSLVISTKALEIIWRAMMKTFTGYLTFYVEPVIYPEMFLLGMAVYLVVALMQFRRIKKIPMEEALKNVE